MLDAEETKADRAAAWAEEQRRLSLKGLAACALAKRDLGAARTLFGHLLAQGGHSGSLRGQLQSDYGWTLFLEGEGQVRAAVRSPSSRCTPRSCMYLYV